jgi:hypothetical protein
MPCHAHAGLCHGLEKSLSERRDSVMALARHGMCESNSAVLFKSIGKNSSAAWHEDGNVWVN